MCDICKLRCHPMLERSKVSKNANDVLELLHCDVQRPIANFTGGVRYSISRLDEASEMLMLCRFHL